MTSEQLARIEEIFHKARILPPSDRASYLDEVCAGNLELRREVESLLTHADRGTGDINLRAGDDGVTAGMTQIVDRGEVAEGPGARIGPYKILQQIGEGGFGVVYMAEQTEPVQRKVAIKVIKLGMDTKQVIARFEAERQALAMMDHPNIARVLDAGATEAGRPYFVMELVRGVPVTEYCDSAKLDAEQRLQLFVDICYAVQHAHQKGIIHRDLKPSNVLVTLHDDRPVPKIIDFGIAKATSHRLTEKTLFTEFRQFIGTPEYMSPDQAEISGLDVDTRSDIYSLGVLLYELLTGTTPFDPETLRASGYVEMQRIIREVDPPIPSTRVTSMGRRAARPTREEGELKGKDVTVVGGGSSLESIAQRRRVEAPMLGRMLRGDLDWIVMKAMEKDRTRRYQTALDLVMDVERFLDDRPVEAGPPGGIYRLRKFARRHRVGIVAGSIVVMALLSGTTLSAVGFLRAHREAQRSSAVSEFLQSLIIDLEAVHSPDSGLTPEQIVSRGHDLFGEDPAVMGTLLKTRASTLETAGHLDEAIDTQRRALAQFRDAFPEGHASVAGATYILAEMLRDRREYVEAETLFREAIEMREELHGDGHALTAEALEGLTTMLVTNFDASRNEEIRELWTRTVNSFETAYGPRSTKTVRQLCERATWLFTKGFKEEGAIELAEATERSRDVLPEDDLTLFVMLNTYAQHLLLEVPDLEGGIRILRRMRTMSRAMWGDADPVTLTLSAQIALFAEMGGMTDAADEATIEFIELREASGSRDEINYVGSLARVVDERREWMDANPHLGRKLALFFAEDGAAVVGQSADRLASVLGDMADWLADHKFWDDAAPMYQRRLEIIDSGELTEEGEPAHTLIRLGEVMTHQGKPDEALPLLERSLQLRTEALEPQDWRIASVQAAIGWTRAQLGEFEEAERILLEAHEAMRGRMSPTERQRVVRGFIVELYEKWNRPESADQWR